MAEGHLHIRTRLELSSVATSTGLTFDDYPSALRFAKEVLLLQSHGSFAATFVLPFVMGTIPRPQEYQRLICPHCGFTAQLWNKGDLDERLRFTTKWYIRFPRRHRHEASVVRRGGQPCPRDRGIWMVPEEMVRLRGPVWFD